MSTQSAYAGGVAVAVKASTLGAGVELTTNIVPGLLNARLQVNGFKYNKTITETQVTYDGRMKLFSAGAIADIYPFAGKFRISGGLYYNGNKIDITGTPTSTQTFTFNGTSYTAAQVGSVHGTIDFNNLAPYLGIGWGDAISSGSPFGFSFEVGALYQGKPKTSIVTSKTAPGLSADIAAEKKKLDDSLNNFKFYPVVSLGFNWRF
ncbi:MAG: hypothetical protein GXP59_02700 [Deltaproteobacteria bacterium]|nr:hypothetical protein [Deltaproteobacteria bacterium]